MNFSLFNMHGNTLHTFTFYTVMTSEAESNCPAAENPSKKKI